MAQGLTRGERPGWSAPGGSRGVDRAVDRSRASRARTARPQKPRKAGRKSDKG